MLTRTEKHKEVFHELKKEKRVKLSKFFLKLLFIVTIIIIVFYLYLRFIGTSFIQTKEYIINDSNIPFSFHGVKVLHISDLLYGSTIDESDLDYLSKEIVRINPDIVTFTGDIISDKYKIKKDEITNLNYFFKTIPFTIGKYAVKGEMDNSVFDLIIKETNFNILNNDYELVYNNDLTPIIITGLNINHTNSLSLNNLDNSYIITLIHNFDYYDSYKIKSNLVLAGHNLSGEIYIPKWKGLLGNNRYNEKYYNINDTIIHISSGLGSIHKLRMFNHPSINVYRLYNH